LGRSFNIWSTFLKIKHIKAKQYSAIFFQEKKSEKLYNYVLYTLYVSPKSLKQSYQRQRERRNLCLAWEIREIHRKIWQVSLKKGGLLEYPGIGVKKILIWILKK